MKIVLGYSRSSCRNPYDADGEVCPIKLLLDQEGLLITYM